jgi:hypothetical protein
LNIIATRYKSRMQAESISISGLDVTMVLATPVLHGTLMVLNQSLFVRPEFLQANAWIYLSACISLLYTLLSCGAGATDLSVAGWISCCWNYNPADALRARAWVDGSRTEPVDRRATGALIDRSGR